MKPIAPKLCKGTLSLRENRSRSALWLRSLVRVKEATLARDSRQVNPSLRRGHYVDIPIGICDEYAMELCRVDVEVRDCFSPHLTSVLMALATSNSKIQFSLVAWEAHSLQVLKKQEVAPAPQCFKIGGTSQLELTAGRVPNRVMVFVKLAELYILS